MDFFKNSIKLAFPLIVLMCLISVTTAFSINGFRNSNLASTPQGVIFGDTGSLVNVSTYYNGNLVPFSKYSCDGSYSNSFDWNCSINVTHSQLVSATSFSFNFTSTQPISDNGDNASFNGLANVNNFDSFNMMDLISGLRSQYDFVVSTSSSSNSYSILITNITGNTPASQWGDGTLYIQFGDPQISTFSNPQFMLGGFNNTYLNGSSSVFTTYFANNFSYAGSGNYFSQPLNLGQYPQAISQVNWTWFEATGLWANGSDPILMDFHFQNDTQDSSGYNASGILGNGVSYQPGCLVGGCYYFNGTNQSSYLNVTRNLFLLNNTNFSISMWINPANLSESPSVNQSFVSEVWDAADGFKLTLTNQGGLNLTFEVNNSGTLYSSTWASIATGFWYQLTGTFNGSSAQLYVNGVAASQPSYNYSLGLVATNGLIVGANSTLGGNFNGSIDEVEVWNRTLLPQEASALYNWTFYNYPALSNNVIYLPSGEKNYSFNASNLLGWWNLGNTNPNEIANNVSYDLSGYGNSAVFGGNASYGLPSINTTNSVIGPNSITLTQNLTVNVLGQIISVTPSASATYNSIFNVTNFTFAAWVYPLPHNSGSIMGAGRPFFGMNQQLNNSIFLEYTNVTGSTIVINSNATVPLNQWDYLVATVNQTSLSSGSPLNLNLYINGQPSGAYTLTQGWDAASGTNWYNLLLLGQYQLSNTNDFNGSINDFKIWGRAMLQPEVQALYNSGCPTCAGGQESNFTSAQTKFIHNFTNVTIALRTKYFGFNNTALVGWWDLGSSTNNESVTNSSLDLSGNGNNALFFGNYTPVVGTSVLDKSLIFNGLGSQLQSVSDPKLGFNYTFTAWVNVANATNGIAVVAYGNGASVHTSAMTVGNPNNFGCSFGNGTTSQSASGASLTSNSWQFVACALTSNTTSFNLTSYINGTLAKNLYNGTSMGPVYDPSFPIYIGGFNTGNFVMNGSIGDVKVFNRTLSGAEIAALYNNGCPTCAGGVEGNWSVHTAPFSGGSSNLYSVSNLVQYRAVFSSSDSNYSAFLNNVTVLYNYILNDSQLGNSWPSNNSVTQSQTAVYNLGFGYNVNAGYYPLTNQTWVIYNASNGAQIDTFSNNSILNSTFFSWMESLPQGNYYWTVTACNSVGPCNSFTYSFSITQIANANSALNPFFVGLLVLLMVAVIIVMGLMLLMGMIPNTRGSQELELVKLVILMVVAIALLGIGMMLSQSLSNIFVYPL